MSESQKEMILAHLQSGQSITPLDALNLFGCFRLGARIFDLKAEGHSIDMTLEDDGNGKHWARYSLAPRKPAMRCDKVGQGMLAL
jgi:Helix-turn-helix domain